MSKENWYTGERDLISVQKDLISVKRNQISVKRDLISVKWAHEMELLVRSSVKRDLVYREKRPSIGCKHTRFCGLSVCIRDGLEQHWTWWVQSPKVAGSKNWEGGRKKRAAVSLEKRPTLPKRPLVGEKDLLYLAEESSSIPAIIFRVANKQCIVGRCNFFPHIKIKKPKNYFQRCKRELYFIVLFLFMSNSPLWSISRSRKRVGVRSRTLDGVRPFSGQAHNWVTEL